METPTNEPIPTLQMGASFQTNGEAPQGSSQAITRIEPLLLCWKEPVRIKEVRPERQGWSLKFDFTDSGWAILRPNGTVDFLGFEDVLLDHEINMYRNLVEAWKRKRNWKPKTN